MVLERFNQHAKFLEFDPVHGRCIELTSSQSIGPVKGVGDLLEDSCVALVEKNSTLCVYVNGVEFNLGDPDVELLYEHKGDGTTVFTVRDATKNTRAQYTSWWKKSGQVTAAFGSADDEDEDICAYIIFMTKAANRTAHLIRKYA